MTKQEIESANALVENALKRMGKNVGAGVSAKLNTRYKSDPGMAQFAIGDEISVPNDTTKLFEASFNGNPSYGVVCASKSADGVIGAKTLFFSALDRGIAEYDESLQPTGTIVYSKTEEVHDVYDAAHGAATDGEVFNAIKGKTLKVVGMNDVKAARYNREGQITGIRDRKIAVFKFA